MKQHKATLTIGIPAYNEEHNIRKLLTTLLSQEHRLYRLKKIIIISDASTDKTARVVQNVHNPKVLLLQNKLRRGQIFAQNLIFETAKSDIVVLLEADTVPSSSGYLDILIRPLISKKRTGVTQGSIKIARSRSVIGNVLAAQKDIYHRFTVADKQTRQWFSSGRGGRAFSKEVYSRFRWPESVPEDDYLVLWCDLHNIRRIFRSKALCYYEVPQTITDYVLQLNKNNSARTSLERFFPRDRIAKIYDRPINQKILMTIHFLVSEPVYFFAYVLLQGWVALFKNTADFTDLWPDVRSTKHISTL